MMQESRQADGEVPPSPWPPRFLFLYLYHMPSDVPAMPETSDGNLRNAKREKCRKEARIAVMGQKGPEVFAVTTSDISASGIAFSSTRPFAAGAVFVLSVQRPGQTPLKMTGTIVHCKVAGRGSFSIGA